MASRLFVTLALLALLAACGDDDDSPTDSDEPILQGIYEGRYLYTQYLDGNLTKNLGQTVEVRFDDSLFLMRKHPSYTGEPRQFCDIIAPYTDGSSVTINCPTMQYDCPEYEHPCGSLAKTLEGDSLKLNRDYTDTLGWRHINRMYLRRTGN